MKKILFYILIALLCILGTALFLVFLGVMLVGFFWCGCGECPDYDNYNYPQVTVFRSQAPKDLGTLVKIDGGAYLFGCAPKHLDHPAHAFFRMDLFQPVDLVVGDFYLGKYPVTAKEFAEFLNDSGIAAEAANDFIGWRAKRFSTVTYSEGHFRPLDKYDHCPATPVLPAGALAYCKWLEIRTGFPVRLPSEVEWEYAAQGQEKRLWPWGEEPPEGRAWFWKYSRRQVSADKPAVVSVAEFPNGATPQGIYAMLGEGQWTTSYFGGGGMVVRGSWWEWRGVPRPTWERRVLKEVDPVENQVTFRIALSAIGVEEGESFIPLRKQSAVPR